MIITYFGKQFFKIQQGNFVVAFNPISKDSKWKGKIARFGSDVALSTTNHPDFNGIETVTYGENIPLSITGPGDYEVRDIFVKGVSSKVEIDGDQYFNTIYKLAIDGINICFLGALSGDIPAESREAIMNPDVLFIPIGGKGVLTPSQAYKLATSLEPMIIIPMDYGDDRDSNALKVFLKEADQEKLEALDKLTLKRKDLDGKEGDVVVLGEQN